MWVVESGSTVRSMPSAKLGRGLDVIADSTAEEVLAKRFCAWRGVTGERYVASVFAADPQAADYGLPVFAGCIVMSVSCADDHRRIIAISGIEKASERCAAIDHGRAAGVDEWHVHFLADTHRARAAAVADLTRRHMTTAG